MREVEFVSGEGWISDDSSLYGEEGNQSFGDRTITDINRHQKGLNAALLCEPPLPVTLDLNNAGRYSWHQSESPEEFVRRVPPLTTTIQQCDWIWVHNPYLSNKAMEEARLMRCGQELLKSKEITGEDLQEEITDLAVETNVLSGKWMLFPKLDAVTRVWRLVVEGVINNKLGPTAKVSPFNEENNARLICVYTKDFTDQEDVFRVLLELVAMGVVSSNQAIYYKTDVYTMLGIYGANAAGYGLKASHFSSQKMLADGPIKQRGPRQRELTEPLPRKRQKTLDGLIKPGGTQIPK
ncbi:unnamed protein product [Periconia digitata]|uniref:DUF1917-domain-containing protein n=1 Tax=Periconia digitata TaxID=1303443 RepID=A0A9W4UHQ9_9PLEO|nr:unnamed protein product [Periconia digitata]